MQLLILLSAALALGYWLSRSKFHKAIDTAAQQPKNWWNRLVNRSVSGGTAVQQSNTEQEQEK